MNRKILIALVALIVVAIAGYCIWTEAIKQNLISASTNSDNDSSSTKNKVQAIDSSSPKNSLQVSHKKIVASFNWETYTNTKLGFTFQYPSAWVKDEKDAEVVNRFGAVTEIDINLADTISQTSLLVAYHLPPNGKQLYEYAASQLAYKYPEGTTQIDVAGAKAIQSVTTIKADGRGHETKPYSVIVIDFLDKKQVNEIQLQFKTSLPSEVEVARFNQLLSTFKFIP